VYAGAGGCYGLAGGDGEEGGGEGVWGVEWGWVGGGGLGCLVGAVCVGLGFVGSCRPFGGFDAIRPDFGFWWS